jgi:phosphoribosyl-ATP pyrophosphohydrolase
MNQTLLSKEDVMILDLLERVKKKENTLIEESRKKDFIREIQLENFSSEKRRFLVKLLVQNTELKLACKEERIIANYVTEKFFQTKTLDITKERFPRNTEMTSEIPQVKSHNIPEEQFLQQEIATFQQKLGRIAQLKEKVKIDKGEVANELFKTKTSERMSVILKELSTLLYETNIRLSNSGLMYNYIISKLFKLVDNGKPAYQAETMDWTTTYEEK